MIEIDQNASSEELYDEAMLWLTGQKSTWNRFIDASDGSQDFSVREEAIRQSMTTDALIAHTLMLAATLKSS